MRNYFNIANYVIGIDCYSTEVLDELGEFSYFKTVASSADFEIVIQPECIDVPMGKPYYILNDDNIVSSFYEQEGLYVAVIDEIGKGKLHVTFNSVNETCIISGPQNSMLLRFALWLAFGYFALIRKTIAIHSSAIVYKNQAALFLGESGTGKSTHTALLQREFPEIKLLNDDSPILRFENGKIMAYGSPWSGKTACYRQTKAEVKAFVRLIQAPYNTLEPLELIDAVAALFPSMPPEFYRSQQLASSIYEMLSLILAQTPVYRLYCRPNCAAAQLSFSSIFGNGTARE